jgi:hypothetical protein
MRAAVSCEALLAGGPPRPRVVAMPPADRKLESATRARPGQAADPGAAGARGSGGKVPAHTPEET